MTRRVALCYSEIMKKAKGLNPSREYLKGLTVEARNNLAKRVKASARYLDQIGKDLRTPSRELGVKLEIATYKKINDNDFSDELRQRYGPHAGRPSER